MIKSTNCEFLGGLDYRIFITLENNNVFSAVGRFKQQPDETLIKHIWNNSNKKEWFLELQEIKKSDTNDQTPKLIE